MSVQTISWKLEVTSANIYVAIFNLNGSFTHGRSDDQLSHAPS